jgi:hypothetical protein
VRMGAKCAKPVPFGAPARPFFEVSMGLKLHPKVPHGIYDVMGVLVQFLDLSRTQFVRKRGEK